MRPARPFFALTINWCGAALLGAAAYVVCYSVPLAELPPDPSLSHLHTVARSVAMLMITLSAVSTVVLVMGVIACLREPEVSGAYVAWVGFAAATPFLGYVAINFLTWPLHRHALERAADRGARVIADIERYTAEHGMPPESIAESATSLAAYPSFSYTRFAPKDARRTLWWYDLGARQGRSVTASWSYPDGEIGHAILAIELDGEERVASVRADRASVDVRSTQFDAGIWQAHTATRQTMVGELEKRLQHAEAAEVRALLGMPDGERLLVDTPWELWVRTWPSDVDRFFYWPTKRYPTVLGIRSVIAVGEWAYARE